MKQEKHNLPGEEWRDAVVVVWTLVLTVAAENDAVDGGKTKMMSGEDCCGGRRHLAAELLLYLLRAKSLNRDKWKTLVHTTRISPQQRRGELVPQEVLDRVLAAQAYWSYRRQLVKAEV
ncbi:hypothetical protein POTOM_022932 [Populus tomentosa]|uniref:Uncharacterized protein n=1 Tax=Populus tomentosa TaxID=118781 RepID=A0A8X8CYZ2_POPTO|nr:hypothetical protein POTOM_022932 [Populus tomentosa]